ncbi:VWA domain-containing protein [Granulosicoccus sp.]|nr:VWA domain-containing protein [Granulosicoccus sp.]MDB4223459.1 VWA domain-containing protein [Granulosicoccus sp.]
MANFTQTSLIGTIATVILSLGACSSEQLASDKSPPNIQLSIPQLPPLPAMAEVANFSMQSDAEERSIKKGRLFKNNQLLGHNIDFIPAPSPSSETYANYKDNNTIRTSKERVSTFSIDVDTGAYSNMRRILQAGSLPPRDAIRIEELINYFSYDYDGEESQDQPFSVNTEIAPSPWNEKTHLLQIGLKGFSPDSLNEKAANLVFLIDVSGSMDSPNKLGLLKSSISLLSNQLTASDTVSIVVYAGSSGTVLEPTPGDQKKIIHNALARLNAGGSTHGEAGIELAYQIALENFIIDGTNRVILATDGDFNVGISDIEKLKQLIAGKRKSGIALTTLGFGSGNYNDQLMEQLAQEGNGNYAYIDTLSEARKVLVDELESSLLTIAEDVKIQVEFNPATVSEYRLIGYTNRHLANEDFDNDKVDAGEIGAGHTVTALYEIALAGQMGNKHSANRYEPTLARPTDINVDEIAHVRLRYKLPSQRNSLLLAKIISKDQIQHAFDNATKDYRFAASVAAFGQLLRQSPHLNNFSFDKLRAMAKQATGSDNFGYRQEFIRLIEVAESLNQIERATLTPQTDHGRG